MLCYQGSSQDDEEDEDRFVIERIVDANERPDGVMMYCVKWRGYPDEQNTWEPESHFDSSRCIQDYWELQKKR